MKKYMNPEIEVVEVQTSDIITTSESVPSRMVGDVLDTDIFSGKTVI